MRGMKSIMVDVLVWILVGLGAGLIISTILVVARIRPVEVFLKIMVGILGAILGGSIGRMTGFAKEASPMDVITALVGAAILLILFRIFTPRDLRT